jgi:hypothetical protein
MKEVIARVIEEAISEFQRMNDECANFESERPDDYAMIYQNSLIDIW